MSYLEDPYLLIKGMAITPLPIETSASFKNHVPDSTQLPSPNFTPLATSYSSYNIHSSPLASPLIPLPRSPLPLPITSPFNPSLAPFNHLPNSLQPPLKLPQCKYLSWGCRGCLVELYMGRGTHVTREGLMGTGDGDRGLDRS